MTDTSMVLAESQLVKIEVPSPHDELVRPVEPEILIRAHQEWVGVIQRVLEPERDYGVIPGTGKKPTLLKPGAERICIAARFVIAYDPVESEIDHDRPVNWTKNRWDPKTKERVEVSGSSVGLYRYVVRCRLTHRGSGVLAGEGMGSASSMESKYIDRPRDVENTILKMAEKRALVAAVLNTLALSDRFTQDVEDMDFGHATTQRAAQPQPRPVDEVVHATVVEDGVPYRPVVPFGKNKGKALSDMKVDSLMWYLEKMNDNKAKNGKLSQVDQNFAEDLEMELEARRKKATETHAKQMDSEEIPF